MFGYAPDEVLGKHFSLLYPREVAAAGTPDDNLRRAIAHGRATEEGLRVRKDDSTFYVSVALSSIVDDKRGLVGFTKISRDMTKERQAADALRASEAKLRSAMRVGRIGSFEWELAAGNLDLSPEFRELLGLPSDRAIPVEEGLSRVHPADRELVAATVGGVVRGDEDEFRCEFRILLPESTERWVAAFGHVIARRGRAIERIAGVLQDTTESKRVELSLRFLGESSRALASSLELKEVLDCVCRVSVPMMADYAFVHLLEDGELRLRELAHADPERVRFLCRLVEPYLDAPTPPALRTLFEHGRVELIPHVDDALLAKFARRPEQAEAARALGIRSILFAPLVARGRSLGMLTLFMAESQRAFLSSDVGYVEQLASRAAMAIDNAMLFEETRRAVELRDRILAVVSHDLKNPLSSIDMATALLLGDPSVCGQDRARRLLETVQRSGLRMDRLIRDLLDLSSIQTGQLKVERSTCPVRDVVQEAIELHEPLALEKGIRLRRALAVQGEEASCDRDRIIQVFSNLLGNAIKFAGAGDEIVVGASSEGREVRITVADTGPGIAPTELPRIFELYWQGPHDARKGTGLGLFISKGIVEAHGGRIWAESTPGEGTTIHFTLPRSG